MHPLRAQRFHAIPASVLESGLHRRVPSQRYLRTASARAILETSAMLDRGEDDCLVKSLRCKLLPLRLALHKSGNRRPSAIRRNRSMVQFDNGGEIQSGASLKSASRGHTGDGSSSQARRRRSAIERESRSHRLRVASADPDEAAFPGKLHAKLGSAIKQQTMQRRPPNADSARGFKPGFDARCRADEADTAKRKGFCGRNVNAKRPESFDTVCHQAFAA